MTSLFHYRRPWLPELRHTYLSRLAVKAIPEGYASDRVDMVSRDQSKWLRARCCLFQILLGSDVASQKGRHKGMALIVGDQ